MGLLSLWVLIGGWRLPGPVLLRSDRCLGRLKMWSMLLHVLLGMRRVLLQLLLLERRQLLLLLLLKRVLLKWGRLRRRPDLSLHWGSKCHWRRGHSCAGSNAGRVGASLLSVLLRLLLVALD